MKKLLACITLILSLTPVTAKAEPERLEVVATFSILADFAKQIGGDAVHVQTLVPADGDAHAFQPAPSDSKSLSNAAIVIENGLGFEGWLNRLVSASGFKGRVVIASEGITPRQMDAEHDDPHAKGGKEPDPHAWQNVSNTRIYIKNIADAFAQARPSDASAFRSRAKAYDQELEKLDKWIKFEISSIPTTRRKIITSHDAFGYFAAAYGITFLSPQGGNTEIEPTAAEVAKLIDQMKTEKVKRLFFENMANPRLVKQLAKDANADVGPPIYSDALSPPSGPASTYLDMMRYNVTQFKEAMQLNGK